MANSSRVCALKDFTEARGPWHIHCFRLGVFYNRTRILPLLPVLASLGVYRIAGADLKQEGGGQGTAFERTT